jgi:hypothetical protein
MRRRIEVLVILSEAGALFTLVAHRGKHPVMSRHGTAENPAHGWQHSPYTLRDAVRWTGNVGIVTGDYSGGIGAIDADDGAPYYTEAWPKLRQAIRIYRDDDVNRCKWLVRAPRGYVTRGNWFAGLDLLFNGDLGANAVVIGTHMFGAPVLWDGAEIPNFTADELDSIFDWRLASSVAASGVNRHTVNALTRYDVSMHR